MWTWTLWTQIALWFSFGISIKTSKIGSFSARYGGLYFFHSKTTINTRRNLLPKIQIWKKYFFQILKLNHLTLAFFVTSKFEMLGTFDGDLHTAFALGALQPEDQLLGSFCLKHKLDSLDSLKKALIFTWNQFWWKMNFVFNGIVIHNVEIWQLFYAPFRFYVKPI